MDDSKLSGVHKPERFAVVIPVYNHEQGVVAVVRETLNLDMPVFVVDDGSTDSTFDRIKAIEGICILRHPVNQGKGAAIMTGFAEAEKVADWAITLDADGQHHPEDAMTLIRAIPAFQRPIVVGMRKGMLKTNTPWTSRFGRKFSNFWVWVSGGPRMTDSQSGFRIYPIPESMNLNIKARRFQYEVEVLVKAKRKQIPVIEAPVRVTYQQGPQKVSHFHPFIDFFRNFGTFSRLITQRIFGLRERP
ncbi:MAG: glycosyltransferase family 2 protein [Deltaproteobacteria bacterium]|nr:glycosyltransferase family 2 protein [Deltaproteobacteria bacterium]